MPMLAAGVSSKASPPAWTFNEPTNALAELHRAHRACVSYRFGSERPRVGPSALARSAAKNEKALEDSPRVTAPQAARPEGPYAYFAIGAVVGKRNLNATH